MRQVDEVFVASLAKEMLANPTKDVTPMIGLLLEEEEDFDKLHPEAYTYEIIGGNNSRCALELIHEKHPELATDSNFHTRPVSVYQNLTDDEAQYLAVKHNRATDFTHKMTTQDKVELCRTKLFLLSEATDGETPARTTNWRKACECTLMMTVSYNYNHCKI